MLAQERVPKLWLKKGSSKKNVPRRLSSLVLHYFEALKKTRMSKEGIFPVLQSPLSYRKIQSATSASAFVPSNFLFSPYVLSRTHVYLLPVVGLLLLCERHWVFSPITWFWLCKIIASKVLSYKLFRVKMTFFFKKKKNVVH